MNSDLDEVVAGLKNQDRVDNDTMEMDEIGENNVYGENHAIARKRTLSPKKIPLFSKLTSASKENRRRQRSDAGKMQAAEQGASSTDTTCFSFSCFK